MGVPYASAALAYAKDVLVHCILRFGYDTKVLTTIVHSVVIDVIDYLAVLRTDYEMAHMLSATHRIATAAATTPLIILHNVNVSRINRRAIYHLIVVIVQHHIGNLWTDAIDLISFKSFGVRGLVSIACPYFLNWL